MISTLNKLNLLNEYKKTSIQYGHLSKESNSKILPYIFSLKYNYYIFDLVKISKLLKIVGNILERKAEKGEKFLFIGTTKTSSFLAKKYAQSCNNYYINNRWLAGTFTNWSIVKRKIKRLIFLENEKKINFFKNVSKKVKKKNQTEFLKLTFLFEGIKNMEFFPDLVIFLSPLKDILAIQECLKLGIPTVAIIDTNNDPNSVTFPLLGNDDSKTSIDFILLKLINNILSGYKKHFKNNLK
jgi:small subunit ribosomal protein S2